MSSINIIDIEDVRRIVREEIIAAGSETAAKLDDRPEFVEWPKIHRLNRGIIVTEKIDGTNACVIVPEDDGPLWAQSRSRVITPDEDNQGFARWVQTNADELRQLGPGHHFGEWYGAGIQRRYGLSEKRFMLFNVDRWSEVRPACCEVATVLYRGRFDTDAIDPCIEDLRANGSRHVPGFDKPEGIVVFHVQGRVSFKVTLVKDEMPKALAAVTGSSQIQSEDSDA